MHVYSMPRAGLDVSGEMVLSRKKQLTRHARGHSWGHGINLGVLRGTEGIKGPWEMFTRTILDQEGVVSWKLILAWTVGCKWPRNVGFWAQELRGAGAGKGREDGRISSRKAGQVPPTSPRVCASSRRRWVQEALEARI